MTNYNHSKKVVIINDSKKNAIISNAKYSLLCGGFFTAGYFTKKIIDILSCKDEPIVINGEITEYLRKRLDTKPKSWTYSPKYYLMLFLNNLIKYDSEKVNNDDIMIILKYLILTIMPTEPNSPSEKVFSKIIAELLKEIQIRMPFSFKKIVLTFTQKNDAWIFKKFISSNINDINFLSGSSNLEKLIECLKFNDKKLFGEYFKIISSTLKSEFDIISSKCSKYIGENKSALDVNDSPELCEEDINKIKKLNENNTIDAKIKRIIEFDSYQLALFFYNILFKSVIRFIAIKAGGEENVTNWF